MLTAENHSATIRAMDASQSFLSAEHAQSAVSALAEMAVALRRTGPEPALTDRARLLLTDLVGVTVAGLRTREITALRETATSTHRDIGDDLLVSAIAACMLELDEGNKYATGHPAAHVVFAALASCGPETTGDELVTAIIAGYEIAARFGYATRRDPCWHTHGHWGATGAAAAATLLRGGDASQVAAAIDAVGGLLQVTPWSTVLTGDFTRNLWIARANSAGLDAARLAMAGLVENQGSVHHSLGEIVGELHPAFLTEDLGRRWLVHEGYLKLHSCCSYTHAAVDLALALRERWEDPADIAEVHVAIHSLAAPLFQRHPHNRLSAMFSLPFVVSTAVVSGRVTPDVMDPASPAFASAEAFSGRVTVDARSDLDAELPHRRIAEVELISVDGTVVSAAQSNPIGDTAHLPLDTDAVLEKLGGLIGPTDAQLVRRVIDQLPGATPACATLEQLRPVWGCLPIG